MIKQIVLTEEEYNNLLTKKTEVDTILRDTNTSLKKKLDECQAKLTQGSFDNSRVDTPFIVTNDTLHFRSPTDFTIMYNAISGINLGESDKNIYKYTETLALIFNYKPQFNSTSEVKAYRVNLQKKKLITGNIKVDKRIKLLTKD